MRLCEQDFDQISSHLPSECNLVSTVMSLSCNNVKLSHQMLKRADFFSVCILTVFLRVKCDFLSRKEQDDSY